MDEGGDFLKTKENYLNPANGRKAAFFWLAESPLPPLSQATRNLFFFFFLITFSGANSLPLKKKHGMVGKRFFYGNWQIYINLVIVNCIS